MALIMTDQQGAVIHAGQGQDFIEAVKGASAAYRAWPPPHSWPDDWHAADFTVTCDCGAVYTNGPGVTDDPREATEATCRFYRAHWEHNRCH